MRGADARFDRVVVADWSASAAPSPKRESPDAIWLGVMDAQGPRTAYFRTRTEAEAAIILSISQSLAEGARLLIGFDFPMGFPAGFAARLTGTASAQAVWAWWAARVQDGPKNRNNRFEVAAEANRHFGRVGPFWGCPAGEVNELLTATKTADYAALGFAERRTVEELVPSAQPVWKLFTTGAAGSQGIMGQAMLHRLSALPGVSVWPFGPTGQITLAEVYPSLLRRAVALDPAKIKDEVQVRLLARALWQCAQVGLEDLLATPRIAREEGWILGAGHAPMLEAAL